MISRNVSELLMNERIESLEEIAIFLCLNHAKTLSQIHDETGIDKTMIDLFCASRPLIINRYIDKKNSDTHYRRTAYGEELYEIIIKKSG